MNIAEKVKLRAGSPFAVPALFNEISHHINGNAS